MLAAERDCAERHGWSGTGGAVLHEGGPPILRNQLSALPDPVPPQLSEYLSTSVPTEDYVAYRWTFLSAAGIDDALFQLESIKHGYFVFAVSDSFYAAFSLDDGRIHSAYGFDPTYAINFEAENVAQFIDLSAKQFMDHEE